MPSPIGQPERSKVLRILQERAHQLSPDDFGERYQTIVATQSRGELQRSITFYPPGKSPGEVETARQKRREVLREYAHLLQSRQSPSWMEWRRNHSHYMALERETKRFVRAHPWLKLDPPAEEWTQWL